MPRYSVPLKAGAKTRLPYPGRSLQIVNAGAAGSVSLDVEWGGDQQNEENLGAFSNGDALPAGSDSFLALSLTAGVDTTVDLLVSKRDVSLRNGQAVDATISGPLPLPVQTNRGQDAGTPMFVSDALANNVVDGAPVAAGPAAVALMAADATRLEAVIFNQGPAAVAIGMAGITWAKRAIVLNAGDAWVESRAAAKAWQVITDAGLSATVTVQERKA